MDGRLAAFRKLTRAVKRVRRDTHVGEGDRCQAGRGHQLVVVVGVAVATVVGRPAPRHRRRRPLPVFPAAAVAATRTPPAAARRLHGPPIPILLGDHRQAWAAGEKRPEDGRL